MRDKSNIKPKKTGQQKNKNQVNQTNDLKTVLNKRDMMFRLREIYRALHRHTTLA